MDSDIARHLPGKSRAQSFHALYSFRHMQVFTLVARPLKEVIQLWDLYFALGMHMHVVAYVAQLMLMRHKLMEKGAVINNLLSQEAWPSLDSRAVTSLTTNLTSQLSEKLINELENHTTDRELCIELTQWSQIDDHAKSFSNGRRRAKSLERTTSGGEVIGKSRPSNPIQITATPRGLRSRDRGRSHTGPPSGSNGCLIS
mmetsp:Transcript_38383/g.61612  ORF Transcript_38383/g.61612 Transcript_38383/m.61612 type:complete len:200 (-) Transcript_38383:288-887(-)